MPTFAGRCFPLSDAHLPPRGLVSSHLTLGTCRTGSSGSDQHLEFTTCQFKQVQPLPGEGHCQCHPLTFQMPCWDPIQIIQGHCTSACFGFVDIDMLRNIFFAIFNHRFIWNGKNRAKMPFQGICNFLILFFPYHYLPFFNWEKSC